MSLYFAIIFQGASSSEKPAALEEFEQLLGVDINSLPQPAETASTTQTLSSQGQAEVGGGDNSSTIRPPAAVTQPHGIHILQIKVVAVSVSTQQQMGTGIRVFGIPI